MSSPDLPENSMVAMVCDGPGQGLRREVRAIPAPGAGELLVKVLACGVCRTDLHVLDGEVAAHYPIVPGHEIVGRVMKAGAGVSGFAVGDRVGIPWLGDTCGQCRYCRNGQENLCDSPVFTGATRDGGYASHVVASAAFCFPLQDKTGPDAIGPDAIGPDGLDDAHAAPLLCAGLIGWRAYRMACDGLGAGSDAIGLYGFGAAAHILAQIAVAQGKQVFAFTRDGDARSQAFARALGCVWAGGSQEAPPALLDAAIIFAPVGGLVPQALKAVRKGGRVICAGIHMSDIPAFPYADLWGEREIRSVANLIRADGTGFLADHGCSKVRTTVHTYSLSQANEAVASLRSGELDGAAVLIPD